VNAIDIALLTSRYKYPAAESVMVIDTKRGMLLLTSDPRTEIRYARRFCNSR
jgi:hypothetical protein